MREEHERDEQQEHDRPRHGEPRALADRIAERLDLIDVGGLERHHGKRRDAEGGRDVVPVEHLAVGGVDVAEVGGDADQRDQGELDQPHHSGDHDRREGGHDVLRGDQLRERRELARA